MVQDDFSQNRIKLCCWGVAAFFDKIDDQAKGQLISKCLFGIFNSSKKTNEKI